MEEDFNRRDECRLGVRKRQLVVYGRLPLPSLIRYRTCATYQMARGRDSIRYSIAQMLESKEEQDIKCQKVYQRYRNDPKRVITKLEANLYVMTSAKSKPSKPKEKAKSVLRR